MNVDFMKINNCVIADIHGEALPHLPLWTIQHWQIDYYYLKIKNK